MASMHWPAAGLVLVAHAAPPGETAASKMPSYWRSMPQMPNHWLYSLVPSSARVYCASSSGVHGLTSSLLVVVAPVGGFAAAAAADVSIDANRSAASFCVIGCSE